MTKEEVVTYFENPRSPLPLNYIAKGTLNTCSIIAAINPRATEEVIRGVLRAAKKKNAVVIFELALSEMSISGGYTGYTPELFANRCKSAAEKEKWFAYALHADHLTVKKGTDEEMEQVKKEIEARVNAGFTGYAIDTSFLFDRNQSEVKGQLEQIIKKGLVLFEFLEEQMKGRAYGLEGEVGEIGITEYTTVEEATFYVRSLKEHGVTLDYLAIANGSKHGVNVDAEGNIIPQLGINVKRTVEIVDALKEEGFGTRIAQHGITGTPIDVIESTFPHGAVAKGNIGTHWQNVVYSVLEEEEPELYSEMRAWVLENYMKEGVDEHKVFASNAKRAWKPFFNKIENLKGETKEKIIEKAEEEMLKFIKALKMENTAELCYQYITSNDLIDSY
ncbi:MAG: class II fructose-bisphosphate aldolase [Candidatus Heimdallarchaeum aukensis]|uniref:Class II fructose-bisphosphate aldolase n=1 Tax=Candidatus Heimdallarchaeum aukensis TaxID=2876573 RepID=A0A9Y1BN51_9ARCH|nr:MAG: class II fructose-bisphosphate aldolase [Candidatus Heimdallarchaeum aukensis]